MIRPLALVGVVVIASGCNNPQPSSLGAAVEGAASTIAQVQQTNVNASVVLRGTMTRKCPTAGCWFLLEDTTGRIKVDTKSAGFVVVDVPVSSSLLVAGRVVTNGSERIIDATGVRSADGH